MLDEKLIKFLALQRIHQLFPSRVQASPGSVGAHPLASGGHHTEGARAHICRYSPPSSLPSVCERLTPLLEPSRFSESQCPLCAFHRLSKALWFLSPENRNKKQLQLSHQTQGSLLNSLSCSSTLRYRGQLLVPLGICGTLSAERCSDIWVTKVSQEGIIQVQGEKPNNSWARGTWLTQLIETLELRVMRLSPVLGMEPTLKIKKKEKKASWKFFPQV